MKLIIPDNIEKIDRDTVVKFLDIKPGTTEPSWALEGIGISDMGIEFNPQVNSEKWVIEKNSRNDHSSNQKQSSISKECYKNDPCFEFIRSCIDKLNCKTHILDVEFWNEVEDGVYKAKKSDGKVVVTKYLSDKTVIEYDLYYDGDPVEGTVTMTKGVPTFTPSAD